jgi:hypothetical protein
MTSKRDTLLFLEFGLWCRSYHPIVKPNEVKKIGRANQPAKQNPKSEYVGVGIMVAHNPLLRSGHAVLLHPAPALGNDAKTLPGIRVTDANLRKPAGNMALHPSPRQVSPLTTPSKHAPPDPTHCQSKVTDRYRIHGHSVVPHVASHHRAQVPTHLWNGLVHALPKFFFDLLQLRLPSPAHRLPQHHELSLARLTTAMGEPKKVKGVGLSLPRLRRCCSAYLPNSIKRVFSE